MDGVVAGYQGEALSVTMRCYKKPVLEIPGNAGVAEMPNRTNAKIGFLWH